MTVSEKPSVILAAPRRSVAGLTLEVDHVTKRYGKNVAVDDLSFRVEPGRVTGFLGPNGSGKSTTMKVILDLAAADKGHASLGGVRYRDLADPARTVGVVLEPNAFHPGRSARNHLSILAITVGIPRTRVDEVLELVGLSSAADRHVGAFSLGMKQRLSLAGALLGDPPVLILDEPGNGLDPQGIRALRDLLRARADAGHTVFLSSHLLSEVEQLVDEVIVLNEGRLVTSGTLHELQRAAIRVRCAAPEVLADALRTAGALVQLADPDLLLVRDMTGEAVGEVALRTGVALRELAPDTSSLEDLFLGWTGTGSPMTASTSATEGSS
jgi:ABC-2 type transport system ATP-binding protein